jgi:ribonuclease HI
MTTPTLQDAIEFDGGCAPNPGGAMGFGAAITWADGRRPQRCRGEAPRAPGNTNNVAEYLGLEEGLRAYLAAGGRGPLRIIGDSKIVIGHIEKRRDHGLWPDKPHLAARCRAVFALLDQVSGGWTIAWRSQEENTDADALTRLGNAVMPEVAERTYLADVRLVGLNRGVAARIAALNAHPSPKFKHFAELRTAGTDQFSRMRLGALRALAEQVHPSVRDGIRYANGAAWAAALEDAFPDDTASQEIALRYALRGLFLDAAIRKTRVDAEIRHNAEMGAAQYDTRFHDQAAREQKPQPRRIGRTPVQERRRRS